MLSPRIRRLKLDYEMLRQRLAAWPLIRMVGTSGMPPELYRFQYLIRGLYVAPDGAILERHEHVLEVNLSLGYPRRAPQCRMLTPVFHPNFDEASVCIGDFWAASESLDDLIIRIGRMISTPRVRSTDLPPNGPHKTPNCCRLTPGQLLHRWKVPIRWNRPFRVSRFHRLNRFLTLNQRLWFNPKLLQHLSRSPPCLLPLSRSRPQPFLPRRAKTPIPGDRRS
jgi:ubiquitin-protein ligase